MAAPTPEPPSQPVVPSPRRRFDVRRVYTAALLAPAIYAIIRYLPAWCFTLLVITGGCLALYELYRMTFTRRQPPELMVIGLAAAALVIGHSHVPLPLGDLLLLSTVAVVVAMLISRSSPEHRVTDASVTLFGVLYIGLTLGSLVATRALPAGEWLVLFVALVTWAGDTGAYYTGSLWGTHLLAPRVSPKKTVEGLVGGLGLALITSLLARITFVPQLTWWDALLLGTLLTAAGLVGDLCESAMKRSVGVKDSGGLLPGHGGMLDRLDSLLFTAPAFYYYIAHVRGLAPPA